VTHAKRASHCRGALITICVTGHPGKSGMAWHRWNSKKATFTTKDASLSRTVCRACAQGTMRQTPSNPHSAHRQQTLEFGQQWSLDAHKHATYSLAGNMYCDMFRDHGSYYVYAIFTKSRVADELCGKIDEFFARHPPWKNAGCTSRRFIRTDPEPSYMSLPFLAYMARRGYEVERTPPRDKHANGIAERTVGIVVAKANVALLASVPRAPQRYWDLAIMYACVTMAFNCHSAIEDCPYHMATGQQIGINHLHPFWAKCYVYIPLEQRSGKLGFPRIYNARFEGYALMSVEFRTYYVVEDKGHGVFGKVRCSKDVVFDDSDEYIYWTDDNFPAENAYVVAAVAEDPEFQVPEVQVPEVQVPVDQAPQVQGSLLPYPPRSFVEAPVLALLPHSQEQATEEDIPDTDLPPPALHEDDIEDIAVYWYKLRADYEIGKAPVCFKMQSIAEKDTRVPINHRAAMPDPVWRDTVDKELSKFEVNHCLHVVPYTGQHKVPMM
jgi:hypothetical protein